MTILSEKRKRQDNADCWQNMRASTPLFCPFATNTNIVLLSISQCSVSGDKRGVPSGRECLVVTHAHRHYKACEMHSILKQLVIGQDNMCHCLTNGQTSFSENSHCCLHTGGPKPNGATAGRSLGHALEIWGGLLQQLP